MYFVAENFLIYNSLKHNHFVQAISWTILLKKIKSNGPSLRKDSRSEQNQVRVLENKMAGSVKPHNFLFVFRQNPLSKFLFDEMKYTSMKVIV